ncbi:uncharacterized protein LOC114280136 [Camellia sinensis]|uniref:uncharacterized protein LOC114280136 n=1 Tax=Camellia sinensis TaxID=4442 RepID=UPI001036934A|nr:uncharacterized protein LOC114280136 [Camellia sinensis]
MSFCLIYNLRIIQLWNQMVLIKRILRCFKVLSGLRINYHKSVVCGVGVDDALLLSFAKLLNCQVHSLPLRFLGLPLGANPGRKSTWKPVLDKIRSKLSGWKRKLLSFVGRLTLIKSTLSSLPSYFLSLFKIPEGVAKEIKRIESAFLCGGNDLKRKVHLVKWGEAAKSINQGGLGIRRIRDTLLSSPVAPSVAMTLNLLPMSCITAPFLGRSGLQLFVIGGFLGAFKIQLMAFSNGG